MRMPASSLLNRMHSPAAGWFAWRKLQAAFRNLDVKIPPLSTVVISIFGHALMSYLTVRDFIPLLKEYRYNNQDTNVQIILLDPNFTVPQISIAIPHYKFYKRRSASSNWTRLILPLQSDCFYKMAANLKSGESRPNSKILEDLLEEYRNDSVIIFYNALSLKLVEIALYDSSDMDDVLRDFPSACRELRQLPMPEAKPQETVSNGSNLDYDFHQSNFSESLPHPLFIASFNFFIRQCRSDYYFDVPQWGTEKLDTLHFKLMKAPARKLEILFAQVLESMCQQTRFSEQSFDSEFDKARDVNRTCKNVLDNPKRSVFFDYVGMWFTVEDGGDHMPKVKEFKFEFALHEQSIWASSEEDAKTMVGLDRRLVTYADASVQYLSHQDQAYASYIYQTPPISWGNDTFGRKITIKYSVQNRARKTRDQNERRDLCFDESSVAQCRLMCTKSKLIDGPCGCAPFAFRRGLDYSNLAPFCDVETYSKCGVKENWGAAMNECLKLCQDSCDYISYSFQIEFEQFEPKAADVREFILKTIPVFNAFTEFTWSKKTTEEQFFAQLAGVANLYLGFSGLSVLAGLAWIVEWLIGRWKKKGKSTEKMVQADGKEMMGRGREPKDRRTDIERVFDVMEKRTKELMEAMKDMKAELKAELKAEFKREWKRDLENAKAKF